MVFRYWILTTVCTKTCVTYTNPWVENRRRITLVDINEVVLAASHRYYTNGSDLYKHRYVLLNTMMCQTEIAFAYITALPKYAALKNYEEGNVK